MQLNIASEENKKIIHHLRWRHNGLLKKQIVSPNSYNKKDPYTDLGSHPDIVEFLWDKLNSNFSEDHRAIVYGTPALVCPHSGNIIAIAYGTTYIIRLDKKLISSSLHDKYKHTHTWSDNTITDTSSLFGDDWLFGKFNLPEKDWLKHD